MSERATSDRRAAAPGGGAVGPDPCGIRGAVAAVLNDPWPEFFSQWCRAADLGPVAAGHVRDVAGRLARPVVLDADDGLARAWSAVHDALGGAVAGSPPLEATA
ncbi:MAG TPA: hypothetical protein VGU73_00170 [Acidimicrobiia bacterium]|nr:hypothetical protein [Acidimicrobiia bacterium]